MFIWPSTELTQVAHLYEWAMYTFCLPEMLQEKDQNWREGNVELLDRVMSYNVAGPNRDFS